MFYGNLKAANDRTHSVKSEVIYVEDDVLCGAQIQMYGLILRLLPSPFKQKKEVVTEVALVQTHEEFNS